MKEAVRLAIGGAPDIGARASAVLTDLMASSGVHVVRTGSVVLEWPNARLPFDPHAWTSERSPEADPVAFAFRRLHGADDAAWEATVDAVRERVADWLREERLRVAAPWPGGATCAIALVHPARPFPPPRGGLRGAFARGREQPLAPYERITAIERAHGATSALEAIDVLAPEQQAQVRALGFALDTPDSLRVATQPGFRRGTAFPVRGFDVDAGRDDGTVELPVLDDPPAAALRTLLDAGGGAALRTPVARFAGDDAEAQAAAYDELLERLRGLGAWLTTPVELARALYA